MTMSNIRSLGQPRQTLLCSSIRTDNTIDEQALENRTATLRTAEINESYFFQFVGQDKRRFGFLRFYRAPETLTVIST